MKPDILYFGAFPDATVAELNLLYTVHHYFGLPSRRGYSIRHRAPHSRHCDRSQSRPDARHSR